MMKDDQPRELKLTKELSYRMKKKTVKRTRFLNNHAMLISSVSPTVNENQIKSLLSR